MLPSVLLRDDVRWTAVDDEQRRTHGTIVIANV